MVKSKAEIMREYRQRLKQDPAKYEAYLSQARDRKKKNYVPVSSLLRRERVRRNDKNKVYLQRHRQKKKVEREIENAQQEIGQPMETSGYDTGQSDHSPLIVNLPFPNRRNGPRKIISRSLAKKSKELKKLKTNYESLQLKYKRTMRSLQRIKKKSQDDEQNAEYQESKDQEQLQQQKILTPSTRTKLFMKRAGLSQKQKAKVKKQLLFGFVVQNQMRREKRGIKTTAKGSLRTLIGGEILKKYRLKKSVSKETGLARNRMKGVSVRGFIRRREVRKNRQSVIDFLLRDDNSRANPGKRDKLKSDGKTQQTRTLTDYLKNLHQKYMSEYPNAKLSLSSFRRIRPNYLKLSVFITRSSCLCTRHQNMAMCARALKGCGVNVPLNPEEFVNDENVINALETQIPDAIKFGQWKRVPVEEKGKKKMIMKIVDQEMGKGEFMTFLDDQTSDFRQHVCRVKRQYAEIAQLKTHLKEKEAILHMDFAENYACKTVEEVQSAYWTQTGVTLHPTVAYFKSQAEELTHKSVVVVSDELAHNSSTVLAILDQVIPRVKQMVPGLQRIHYWTDSPTSQYRNKTIFDTVARHEELHGVKATWNYFESGHGKGPCDGLGGLTKRMADEAVRSGKTVIQDARDFYNWTISSACTIKSVDFMFVSTEECQKKVDVLGKMILKPVPGTMKIHAVVGGAEKGGILKADVSCYCCNCRRGQFCEGHWKTERVVHLEDKTNSANENVGVDANSQLPVESEYNVEYKEEDFVAAVYLKQWYVGQVVDVDDNELEINFMKTNKKCMTFQWPAAEDKIWLKSTDILTKVGHPNATGRSQRAYRITDEELETIKAVFAVKMCKA